MKTPPVRLGLILLLVAAAGRSGSAQPSRDAAEAEGRRLVTPEAQATIDRGLSWLAARQHADGSFWSKTTYRREVAVTALAGLAFLSEGSQPDRGPHGEALTAAVGFVLSCRQPNGEIVNRESGSHGPMYGHGFATLFLAEVYGTTPDPRVRETLSAAVKLIVASQNEEGGWRYQPDAVEADVSVTVCQVMALRAAHNAGLTVPKETIDRAVAYVKRCQNPDGGFMYQLTQRGESAPPRSAAGLVALFSAGVYEGPEIERGLAYLMAYRPRGGAFRHQSHYYYSHYYGAQAMWQAGGSYWRTWYPAARDELVRQQRADGSWADPTVCDEYGAAMALVVLQMPNCYLPIFQR